MICGAVHVGVWTEQLMKICNWKHTVAGGDGRGHVGTPVDHYLSKATTGTVHHNSSRNVQWVKHNDCTSAHIKFDTFYIGSACKKIRDLDTAHIKHYKKHEKNISGFRFKSQKRPTWHLFQVCTALFSFVTSPRYRVSREQRHPEAEMWLHFQRVGMYSRKCQLTLWQTLDSNKYKSTDSRDLTLILSAQMSPSYHWKKTPHWTEYSTLINLTL